MGATTKPASKLTGNDYSEAEKKAFENQEKILAGSNGRLIRGLGGLNEVEMKRLINPSAKTLYDSLAKEAATSSALSNNHIHDLIDLANEYENLKKYNLAIKKYGAVIYDEGAMRFSANPADKMRKDSLRAIDVIKSRIGMRATDIAALARHNAEQGNESKFKNLFGVQTKIEWGNKK